MPSAGVPPACDGRGRGGGRRDHAPGQPVSAACPWVRGSPGRESRPSSSTTGMSPGVQRVQALTSGQCRPREHRQVRATTAGPSMRRLPTGPERWISRHCAAGSARGPVRDRRSPAGRAGRRPRAPAGRGPRRVRAGNRPRGEHGGRRRRRAATTGGQTGRGRPDRGEQRATAVWRWARRRPRLRTDAPAQWPGQHPRLAGRHRLADRRRPHRSHGTSRRRLGRALSRGVA